VSFQGDARFGGVSFQGDAWFNLADFNGKAWFDSVSFQGNAEFNSVSFRGDAWFRGASFRGGARFNEVSFKSYAEFSAASFRGLVMFEGTRFHSDAAFDEAMFEEPLNLGRFQVGGWLRLDRITFTEPVQVEATATGLSCRRHPLPGWRPHSHRRRRDHPRGRRGARSRYRGWAARATHPGATPTADRVSATGRRRQAHPDRRGPAGDGSSHGRPPAAGPISPHRHLATSRLPIQENW
jgi:pentapeptide repeat protein